MAVAIGYRLLTPSSYLLSGQYIGFYKTVTTKVRARGMKFTLDPIVLYNNTNFSLWAFDLRRVSLPPMIDDKRKMAQARSAHLQGEPVFG